MIKAVIFDLDGLLIDSEIIAYKIYYQLLGTFGFEFSIQDYAERYSGKALLENVIHTIKQYDLPWDTQTGVEKVLETEEKLLDKGVNLKPGVKELFAYLKENHYKIALASSSRKNRALEILGRHRILEDFDVIVFGIEVERGKPYPDIFLKACEKVQERPGDCLVLEDSEAGIQAAHAANIPVICVPDMKKPRRQFEEMTVSVSNSLYDVITYLKNKERKC